MVLPFPDRGECPEERGRNNNKCGLCVGLETCEKDAHKDGECFEGCSYCEMQAHEDDECWEQCRYCRDENILKGDCQ